MKRRCMNREREPKQEGQANKNDNEKLGKRHISVTQYKNNKTCNKTLQKITDR